MITLEQLLSNLEALSKEAGSQRRLATEWGLAASELSDCFNGRRKPPHRLLERMGYEAVTMYRPKR